MTAMKRTTARTASSKQRQYSLRNIILILIMMFTSYRIGQQSSLQNYDHDWTSDINIQPSSITATATKTVVPRALRIDESKLPYKCGVVFFYHIPSTGGATIKTWLTKYNKEGHAKFFEHWGRKHENDEEEEERYKVQDTFINGGGNKSNKVGMNNYVTNLQDNEWRIAHCHHSSMNLNITADVYLSQWRSIVEEQGCAFIAATMFRDPLSHALSLFKNKDRDVEGITRGEWVKHLYSKSDRGMWQTQLDYLLYNFLDRNPDDVDKYIKVQRALQLLQDHFDIITIGNHDLYKTKLLSITGWPDIEMKRTNTFAGELSFTKKEVEEMQKLLYDNGDIDFLYEVKKLYEHG